MAKTPWYGGGLRFECTRCGNCCGGDPGYVWATKEEIRRIANFLGRSDGWLDPQHLRRVGFRYSLTEKPGGDCIFLRRDGDKSACTIHAVRPLQCRTWPFWTENLRSPDAWAHAGEKCPGMNNGQHYDLVQIETTRKQRTW
ncbi:MAG: YkgJ family cysteine cluster protein [Phycisphaerae bacterium]